MMEARGKSHCYLGVELAPKEASIVRCQRQSNTEFDTRTEINFIMSTGMHSPVGKPRGESVASH